MGDFDPPEAGDSPVVRDAFPPELSVLVGGAARGLSVLVAGFPENSEAPMIHSFEVRDVRFAMDPGAGSDAVHRDPSYSYAVTLLHDESGLTGSGLAFTLGDGNDLVCAAARFYAERLRGRDIEEVMADFGSLHRKLADEPQFRWLGPHKGVVHLGLASVTNACFDLWAKRRGLPLWRLLIDLEPSEVTALLDLSYLDEVLSRDQALELLRRARLTREERETILSRGYPAYDTSVGWFHYTEEQILENCRRALGEGFSAMKLKVGAQDPDRDVRRATMLREAAGSGTRVMLDANQQWNLPDAVRTCLRLQEIDPYWIEEPTHPDDVNAHKVLAEEIAPTRLAVGEHIPNRVVFKNYLQTGCVGFAQVDVVRVAGVSEFITVSLLCRAFDVPVVPHVGDMGQIHQHLVLFNHLALAHPALYLENIPHLRDRFLHPVRVEAGRYLIPQEPGAGSDLKS